MTTYTLADFVGNIGVALVIGSYLLLQAGKLGADEPAYSIANGAGALFVLISLVASFNLSAFIIQVFWIAISVYGLVRPGRRGPRRESHADV